MLGIAIYTSTDILVVPNFLTHPGNGYRQEFIITGVGPSDLHDIAIWMELDNVIDLGQNVYGNERLLAQQVKYLAANQSVILDSTKLFPPTKEPIHKMMVEIETSFRPSYLPFRKRPVRYKYYVERNKDGAISWRKL